MLKTVTVQEAKTHLSALISRVDDGEEIVITREEILVARLVSIGKVSQRKLGFVPFKLPPSFYDDLSEAELPAWEITTKEHSGKLSQAETT